MKKSTDDVLTIGEMAIYLKIPKSTLYKLVREGKIPSQKNRPPLAFPETVHQAMA